MKRLLLLSLLCLLSSLLLADIMSTTAGGNWANSSTWIGGVVPNSSNNVIIQGNVWIDITGECLNLTIQPGARISNPSNYVGQVTVYGNCMNYGQLVDSGIPGGELRMVILGNLTNTNLINCEYVYYASENAHTFSNVGTFSPTHFLNMSVGMVSFLTNLNLTGTHIYLPHLTLSGFQLSLNGGFMEHTNIVGGGGAILNLTGGAYLNWVTATEIILQGTVLIGNAVSIGHLYNYATVWNRNDMNHELLISGTLRNFGTIGDNPGGFTLNLELQGDIFNYGSIAPAYLTLGYDGTHDIWQNSGATGISAPLLASYSDYRMLSNLNFTGCLQDWNGHSLIMNSGFVLNLNGGALTDAVLDGVPGSTLNLSNSAWLGGVLADELSFSGEVLIGDGVEIDRLINNGTLRSKGDFPHTLTVQQRLENHGSIANASSGNWFYINLWGDLFNYSQITNYQFNLYGFLDHNVLRSASSNITCSGGFRLNSNIGWAQWMYNGILPNEDFTDFRTVNPNVSGVWTPYYYGLLGKNIIFGSAEGSCPVPQNVTLNRNGTGIRLQWIQVPGAFYYTVFSASDPAGPYLPEPVKVFDPNISDGIVWRDLPPAEALRFFRVSAGN